MREAVVRRRRRIGNVNVFLWLGASLLGVFVLLALFGQALAPYDPNTEDLFAMLEPPTAAHQAFGLRPQRHQAFGHNILRPSATTPSACSETAPGSSRRR